MFHYSVFGHGLQSEVPFPELRATPPGTSEKETRWTLRIATASPPLERPELLGTDAVMDGVNVRLYRGVDGYRLDYDDTGHFDVSRDGRNILWSPGLSPSLEVARLDMLNRVLPVALHAAGAFCLHGSAVGLHGAGIAFVAPRGCGKSTLALAMTDFGARILTDDAVSMESHAPVLAAPGVQSVRLLDDAASAVVGDARSLEAVGAYPMTRRDAHRIPAGETAVTKQILRNLPEHKLMLAPVPLSAIYILVPTKADAGAATVDRTPLAAVHAALSLVVHAKSGALLGKSEAPLLFDRAVRIAREVPVYHLAVIRDLRLIKEVARQLADWHAATPRPEAARA
jgi:hypothetical protein